MGETQEKWVTRQNGQSSYFKYHLQLETLVDIGVGRLRLQRFAVQTTGQEDTEWTVISRALPPSQTAHILCKYQWQKLYSRKRPSIWAFLRQLRRRGTFLSWIFRTFTAFSSKQSTCQKDILELEVFLPYTSLFLNLMYMDETEM